MLELVICMNRNLEEIGVMEHLCHIFRSVEMRIPLRNLFNMKQADTVLQNWEMSMLMMITVTFRIRIYNIIRVWNIMAGGRMLILQMILMPSSGQTS